MGEASIRVDAPTVSYFVFAYTITAAAIFLNTLEIHLLRSKWQKVTDFELILCNLSMSDILTGFFNLAIIITDTYMYVQKAVVMKEIVITLNFHFMVAVIMSANFVILIGVERVFAIKLPLKHRMFHLKRRRVNFTIALIWIISIAVCATAIAVDQKVNNQGGEIISFASVNLGIAYGGLLTIQSAIVLILYTCIAAYVLKRRSRLKSFNRDTIKASRKSLATSWKMERSSLTVCVFVVITFLFCTIPFSIRMYKGEFAAVENLLLLSNSMINPCIYFFKTMMERRITRRALTSKKKKLDTMEMSDAKQQSSIKDNLAFEKGEV